MKIDKKKMKTQDDLNEKAPMDQVDERIDAEMKTLKGRARRTVAESLQNDELADEGRKLEMEGEKELDEASRDD